MPNTTEQKHRNYLKRILYFYWLLELLVDIVTTLNGWLALDNNYVYNAYDIWEIVLSTASIFVNLLKILWKSTIIMPGATWDKLRHQKVT